MSNPERVCQIFPSWAIMSGCEKKSPDGQRKFRYGISGDSAVAKSTLRLITCGPGIHRELFTFQMSYDKIDRKTHCSIKAIVVDKHNKLHLIEFTHDPKKSNNDRQIGVRTSFTELVDSEQLTPGEPTDDYYRMEDLPKKKVIDFGVAVDDFLNKAEKPDLLESYNELPIILTPEEVDELLVKNNESADIMA